MLQGIYAERGRSVKAEELKESEELVDFILRDAKMGHDHFLQERT